MVKRMQNIHEKAQLEWVKIVTSFISVMQAFHPIQIHQKKRKEKKFHIYLSIYLSIYLYVYTYMNQILGCTWKLGIKIEYIENSRIM